MAVDHQLAPGRVLDADERDIHHHNPPNQEVSEAIIFIVEINVLAVFATAVVATPATAPKKEVYYTGRA